MRDISVPITTSYFWDLVKVNKYDPIKPKGGASFMDWYEFSNTSPSSVGRVHKKGFQIYGSYAGYIPIAEVQEKGETLNEKVVVTISLEVGRPGQQPNSMWIKLFSSKDGQSFDKSIHPSNGDFQWVNQGNGLYTVEAELDLPRESMYWGLGIINRGSTQFITSVVVKSGPTAPGNTLKVAHPDTHQLTDVTTKMFGSVVLKPTVIQRYADYSQSSMEASFDLTSMLGKPSRKGKLLVVWPGSLKGVSNAGRSGYIPGEYIDFYYKWGSGSRTKALHLSIPSKNGAVYNWPNSVRVMFPPLLLDIPVGRYSSVLTLEAWVDGGSEYEQPRIPPAIFIPC